MGRWSWCGIGCRGFGKLSVAAIVVVVGCGRAEPSRVAPVLIEVPPPAPASAGPTPPSREVVDEEPPPKAPAAEAPVAGSFSCSMHPQIQEATPGACPICGMDLVEK